MSEPSGQQSFLTCVRSLLMMAMHRHPPPRWCLNSTGWAFLQKCWFEQRSPPLVRQSHLTRHTSAFPRADSQHRGATRQHLTFRGRPRQQRASSQLPLAGRLISVCPGHPPRCKMQDASVRNARPLAQLSRICHVSMRARAANLDKLQLHLGSHYSRYPW